MDKLDILFIRACKSQNPNKRLLSLYRRFYSPITANPEQYIVVILSKLCDKYCRLSTIEILNELDPASIRWVYGGGEKLNYYQKCIKVLVSKIRLEKVSVFEGFISPARFRK